MTVLNIIKAIKGAEILHLVQLNTPKSTEPRTQQRCRNSALSVQ